MDRSKFSFDEFLENESFIHWVKHPNEESDRYWEVYIQTHPDRENDIEQARLFITAVNSMENEKPSPAQSAEMWSNIQLGMQEAETPERPLVRMQRTWMIAASVLVVVVLSSIFYLTRNGQETIQQTAANTPFLESPVDFITVRNELKQPKKITLADGSIVQLESNSLLSYHSDFNTENREVLLEGEAFF